MVLFVRFKFGPVCKSESLGKWISGPVGQTRRGPLEYNTAAWYHSPGIQYYIIMCVCTYIYILIIMLDDDELERKKRSRIIMTESGEMRKKSKTRRKLISRKTTRKKTRTMCRGRLSAGSCSAYRHSSSATYLNVIYI